MPTFTEISFFVNTYPAIAGVYFFLMGASIGSFMHFMAYRVGHNMSVSGRSSKCDHCGEPIKSRYNIPFLGYLIIKGKTACCEMRLSPLHFVVETAFGVITALSLFVSGINVQTFIGVGLIYLSFSTVLASFYRKDFTDETFWVLLSCLLIWSGVKFNNELELLIAALSSRLVLNYTLDLFRVSRKKYINMASITSTLVIFFVL
tara:strand:- start:3646 stop:4257 length:612 start_codon:yes stop_codon:yes gene_type:complete